MKWFTVENVEVIDLADKGKSVGKIDNKAVFIEGAVPGDIVNVEIRKRNKSFDEGVVVKLVQPSQYRTDPFCSHFGLCGGCKWQNLQYSSQLKFKEKVVIDTMHRIAKIPDPVVNTILGAENNQSYRNKMEYTFTNKRYLLKSEMDDDSEKQMNGLGLHIPGKFNKVLHIDTCYLQDKRADAIRNFVHTFALNKGNTYFDLKVQNGLLRNLIIRNTSIDEWMVVVVFKENHTLQITALLDAIKSNFPFINSLQYIINAKRNDSLFDQDPILYHGEPFIIEQLEHLKFKVGPKSFFQTNSSQALKLYNVTRDFAGLSGDEIVYDLYTGTGSIAAFVAAKAKKVIGIEYIKEAIDDAIENASLNGINNMTFYAGDMKDVLTRELFSTNGNPDVIITDPPRAGMHEAVVKRILESGAKKIVYVSCNPATQARDILLLSDKYEVDKLQPVDMFPHTSHVENVALLKLRI